MTPDQLILPLDVDTAKEALHWVDRFHSKIGTFKVGLQLFTSEGPQLVKEIRKRKANVFLDLKLHDIPNTVAKSVASVCQLDIRFLTIHTSGGRDMMQAAVQASEPYPQTTILGVTVLTSLNSDDLTEIGFDHTPAGQVLHLARLACDSGLKGLVCSPLEAPLIRSEVSQDITLVTPGVRPAGSSKDDQSRVTTPEQAIQDGSSHVVIGRPILKADNPDLVLDQLLSS